MKFIKKAAALFFCAALTLSVMAVTALADDEAELMAAVSNTDFTVSLVQPDSDTILNRESTVNDGYEINANDEVPFDIKLAYSTTKADTAVDYFVGGKIVSFKFTVTLPQGVTVKDDKVTINNTEVPVSTTNDNTYVYTAAGSSNINIPASATAIGSITFVFNKTDDDDTDTDVSENTSLTPSIKDIEIQVLGYGIPQSPADADTDKPIYVNPTYTATVEHFKVDGTTGVLEKKSDSDTNPSENKTYHFSTGANLTNEAAFPGYKFQGWMVTTDASSSTTWAPFATDENLWNESGSYKKNGACITTQEWTAAETATTAADKLTKYVTNYKVAADSGEQTDVMFIPVAASGNTTAMPAHMAGNITLTPVYTATQYTVTFKADNFTANTGSKASFGTTTSDQEQEVAITERTATYTIEDLKTDGAGENATDYLDIKHADDDKNGGLAKPAFKFVGWLPSNSTVDNADTNYKWTNADYTTTTLATEVSTLVNPQKMRYGNLTLTAVWEVDAYYDEIAYQYAGQNNVLVMVCVPTGNGTNSVGTYTYQFDENDMFIIPAGAQRTAYVGAATNNDFEAHTGANASYDLFAYIAPQNDSDMKHVTIVESASRANDTLDYTDYDIDADNENTIADFGNVDSLFQGDYANIFAITGDNGSDGVRARLKADVYTSNENGSTKKFASIGDIITIYNHTMGYSKEIPTPQQGGGGNGGE